MSLVKDAPSPHIIELFEDPETIVLLMEYLETFATLQRFIELSSGRLQESVVWTLMVQIVRSSIDHGVCHGDIHLNNVMVDIASLKIKLIDFRCGQRIG
ncbi:hypothetical protein M9458_055163, partial [Cirrhinus mrigala]